MRHNTSANRRASAARRLVAVVLLTSCAVVVGASSNASVAGLRQTVAAPTPAEMIGQLLLVRMRGTRPSPAFLDRVRRGEIGGVVLFADNFGATGPAALIAELQQAARRGGRPPLLIAVDQEGGIVKRLPGAPSLAPDQMRTPAVAKAQGLATARKLRAYGIDVDLAPVLDIGYGGFITSRTFGSTVAQVTARGPAFAAGLAAGHVAATAKHFPGLGRAIGNTDASAETIHATRAQLLADLAPYRAAIAAGLPLVLMSTAVYPALGSSLPAACSPAVVRLLRRQLGFGGVVVTDALKTPAVNRFFPTPEAAVRAVEAGVDLVLVAGVTGDAADTDGTSVPAYAALLAAARSGRVSQATISAAYERVVALKRRL